MATATHEGTEGAWRREGADLVRGASGGLLFGVPLLYTMEVWWYGSWVDPRWMLGALGVSFVTVVALTRSAGFRDTRTTGWGDAVNDGVEIVAVGLVCAAAVLVLLRQITWESSLEGAVGAMVFEAIPFAFGAAIARLLLRRAGDDGQASPEIEVGDPAIDRTLADAGAAAVGAVVICFSIAPTDEIPMIAQSMTAPWLVAMAAASLAVSYAIVFAADFLDQEGRRRHEGLFQRPVAETVGAYVISLAVAAGALAFFQRIGPDQSWETWLTQTLVLGLPATIGGAAGRLAV
jgi:putative integral membrane protein (TIGR02587 family)